MMVANPLALAVGTYLTNGTRLVEVRRVDEDGRAVIVEEGPIECADVCSLPLDEVAADWRVVEYAPDPELAEPRPKRKERRRAARA